MFIATVLVLIAGSSLLLLAGNTKSIKAAVTITASTGLLVCATLLVGGVIVPLVMGIIMFLIGVWGTREDLKRKRFPEVGIFSTCLGLIFLGVAIYCYCI